jgi:hypothetical protein
VERETVKIPNSSLLWDMPVSHYLILERSILYVFPACFLGALQFVAANAGKKEAAAKAKIHSSVVLGQAAEMEGFALKVDIKVEGVEDGSLIKAAHEVLLFSPRSPFSSLIHPPCSSVHTAVLSGKGLKSMSAKLEVQQSNSFHDFCRNMHPCHQL